METEPEAKLSPTLSASRAPVISKEFPARIRSLSQRSLTALATQAGYGEMCVCGPQFHELADPTSFPAFSIHPHRLLKKSSRLSFQGDDLYVNCRHRA